MELDGIAKKQLAEKGISLEKFETQLNNFQKGFPFSNLQNPATEESGIFTKSEEEIEEEIKAIEEATKLYFQFNKAIVSEVKEAYQLRVSVYNVSDSLSKNDIDFMVLTGNSIIDNVYKNGFIHAYGKVLNVLEDPIVLWSS